jgi:sugar phosphate permease
MDYCAKEAQGKGYALRLIGYNIGCLMGVGVFVTLIRHFNLETNYRLIFFVPTMMVIVFSLLSPFMIIEPPDLTKKKRKEKERKERLQRLKAAQNKNAKK